MIKNNKMLLIITSLIILLPILLGLATWDRLPDTIATHWGLSNEPNGYSSKSMAVFGMPLCMLAMQWFLVLMTELDIKKKNHNPAMMQLVLWIIPVVSLLMMLLVYGYALGMELNIGFWVLFFTGLLFTVIGNYMPKCRQNWTMGIRLRWTLSDVENWNHTHRLAGPVWVIGGLLIAVMSFFSTNVIVACGILLIIVLMILIPTVYSYLYYKQHRTEE